MQTITWENLNNGTVATSADGVVFSVPSISSARAAIANGVRSKWGNAIQSVLSDMGSNIPLALAEGIVLVESGGDPEARGAAGEVGLFQILPSTAHLSVDQLLNAGTNIRAGISYLDSLLGPGVDLPALISMYNAGRNPSTGRPYSNEETGANFQSEYGFRSSPGYIDAVIRATNYFITGLTESGNSVSTVYTPKTSSPKSAGGAILLGLAILGAYKMRIFK